MTTTTMMMMMTVPGRMGPLLVSWAALAVVVLLGVGVGGGRVAPQPCPLPPGENVEVWSDNPENTTLTVEWGYENLTCSTAGTCGYSDLPPDLSVQPQLRHLEIQAGVQLTFVAGTHEGVPFPIQPFRVDEAGWAACDVSGGQPLVSAPTNSTFLVPADLLQPGTNLFLVENGHLKRCEFGLRVNVTVRGADCLLEGLPCSNRGHCLASPAQGNYTCSCCSRFKGRYCEGFEPCLSQPCLNGGSCTHDGVEDDLHYMCHCRLGYRGAHCEERLADLCEARPCLHNASCRGDRDHFSCQCPPGLAGAHCEVDVDDCAARPCSHGVCVDGLDSFTCFCQPGYYGARCEHQYDWCKENHCQNGGQCLSTANGWTCHCPPAFTGTRCQTQINACDSHPCQNGARCTASRDGRSYQCHCPPGFQGHHCEVNRDDCRPDACLNGGTCRDQINGYSCLCHDMHAGPSCEYTLDMFAPILQGRAGDETSAYHVRNLYIVAGTLSGAVLIVVFVLVGCYCRMHETYKLLSLRRLKYRKQKDEMPGSPCDVSSVSNPRLSIDAIWEATSLSYESNQLHSPLHRESLKPRRI